MMIEVDWRQPFIDYIREQKVPSNKNLAEQLIRRAKSYVLVGDKLYKLGASSGLLMKCVPREEGKGILAEIHKGVCGNHTSSRTLVSKALTETRPLDYIKEGRVPSRAPDLNQHQAQGAILDPPNRT
jgi:hypothetical protein